MNIKECLDIIKGDHLMNNTTKKRLGKEKHCKLICLVLSSSQKWLVVD